MFKWSNISQRELIFTLRLGTIKTLHVPISKAVNKDLNWIEHPWIEGFTNIFIFKQYFVIHSKKGYPQQVLLWIFKRESYINQIVMLPELSCLACACFEVGILTKVKRSEQTWAHPRAVHENTPVQSLLY